MKRAARIIESITLTVARIRNVWHISALISFLALEAGCGGCGIDSAIRETNIELRNAVDTFDRAIDALARQSSDWQVVLQDLEKALVDDVQSTLRVEVTNLLQTGVSSAGGEFRCDVEFLRIHTERELRRIRNDLAETINSSGRGTPIPLLPDLPAEPFICDAVPPAVDLSLDFNRRSLLNIYGFDLRSRPITAEVVGLDGSRNVTSFLGIISDMHMVLNLTDTGAAVDENSQYILFSWNKKPQSVISILSPTIPLNCDIRTVTITGDPQSFIPPRVGRGDQDYYGNGPCVAFSLHIELDVEGKTLTARYRMTAKECDERGRSTGDYTMAEGSGTVELFRGTQPGQRILGHNLTDSMSHNYTDSDHADDTFTFAGTNPVEKLIFVGDTDGDDAGINTGVTIYFREMEIQVETCSR